jgi:hypothetical protein
VIYPLPSSGVTTFRIDGAPRAEVSIFDVLGREVDRFSVEGVYEWQPHSLPAGTYVVRAESEGTVITKRIVLE